MADVGHLPRWSAIISSLVIWRSSGAKMEPLQPARVTALIERDGGLRLIQKVVVFRSASVSLRK